jgi:hypothetical protein
LRGHLHGARHCDEHPCPARGVQNGMAIRYTASAGLFRWPAGSGQAERHGTLVPPPLPLCMTRADGTAKLSTGVSVELRRQDFDLPRLRPGIRVYGWRAGVLRRQGVRERAVAVPGLPRGSQGLSWRGWRELRWQLRLRRLRSPGAPDVLSHLLDLRPGGPGAVPAARRQAGLLLGLLHAEAEQRLRR